MMKRMRQTHLSAVDLNLLVAFEALMREQSVSRAAQEMGLSQPAMSRTLSRLRDLFEDPLLVRMGHRMVATPKALDLVAPVNTALAAVRRTLEPAEAFDPATARREFRICAFDTTQAVVLPRLLARLAGDAPGVDVVTAPLHSNPETFRQLAADQRDLAIGRFETVPEGVRCAPLYRDRIVCLAREGHPRVRSRLTLKRYLAEAHLAPESESSVDRPFTIDALLAKEGLTRRVVCTVENLAMAPFVVARSDLLCTAPGETIAPFARGLGLRVFEPPFDAPSFDLQLAWHERSERDEGHAWLRQALLDLFA